MSPLISPFDAERAKMPPIDASRNLLFGLLALQNSFIDRDALLDAFNRWVHDKVHPLGKILVERGALAPDEFALLDALVAKHLEKFNNDPEQSLAALSSIGSVRDDLSRIADPQLHAVLGHVSAARRARIRSGPALSRRPSSAALRRPEPDSSFSGPTPWGGWVKSSLLATPS